MPFEPRSNGQTILAHGNGGHPFLIFDHDLSLLGANPAAEYLFGISTGPGGADVGKNILNVVPGIGGEEAHEAIQRLLRTGEPCYFDLFLGPNPGASMSLEAFRVAHCLVVTACVPQSPAAGETLSVDALSWHWALLDAAENLGQGIVILQDTADRDAAIVYVNDAGCRILGHSRGVLLSMSALDFFEAEALASMRNRCGRRRAEQSFTAYCEASVKTADGVLVPLECSATNMNRGGEVATVILFRDVRRDKEMEKALADSGEQYRVMVDTAGTSGIGIEIVQDMPGREAAIVFVNDAYCDMLGYTREELLSMSEWDLILPDELGKIQDRYRRRRRGLKVPNFYRMTLVRKDGRQLPIETSVSLMKRNGHVACVSYFRDITERTLVEIALAQSEEQHRALVEATGRAGLGIEIVQNTPEREAAIVFVNDEYCHILGYTREELLSISEWDVIAPAEVDRVRDLHRRRQSGEEVVGFYETVVVRKDGSLLPVATSVSTMIYNGRAASVSYFRDITEQKIVEAKLKRSSERLRQLSTHLQHVREEEAKRIAREIHDDLGQTLTALKMDISWLSGKLLVEQPALLGKVESMAGLADMAIHAVRRVSTALRPQLLDELGLAAAIEWQLEEFQEHADVETVFVSNMKEMILDQDRATAIFRIFQEALRNVARHANATKIRVTLNNAGTEILLKVRDNGIGITQDQVGDPKSFGLTGMRERATFWGGKVQISGSKGKGTVVTATIPVDGGENPVA